MFMTAKIPWKQLAALLTLTAAFALCLLAGNGDAQAASATIPTDEELCLTYLDTLGWETEGNAVAERILLPETFGEEFQEYLALQTEGGFDLEAYRGKTITRYSFSVTNYPTGEDGILADLLVLDGEIIGGELRSNALDGFMLPLKAQKEVG